ncbi:MAG: nucleotidyl transferase AbiEii/AbiGii toxin family protein [Elusimicrobiota bacterium]
MNRENLPKIIPAVAQEQGFRQEIIEKDFYLTLVLNHIYSDLGKNLVFKGGTLLNKMHLNYHRLSEDLDFTLLSDTNYDTRSKRSRAMAPIREKMAGFLKLLGLKSTKPEGEGFNNSTHSPLPCFTH